MPLAQYPKHFRNLKGHQLRVETTKFKVRLAALMSVPSGTVRELSQAVGLSDSGLSKLAATGYLPGDLCVKLEMVCGKADFPRQWFNPELFSTVGA